MRERKYLPGKGDGPSGEDCPPDVARFALPRPAGRVSRASPSFGHTLPPSSFSNFFGLDATRIQLNSVSTFFMPHGGNRWLPTIDLTSPNTLSTVDARRA